MPRPEELIDRMNPETPKPVSQVSDVIPQDQKDPGFDLEDIQSCLIDDLKNDIADKEDYGWLEKREYDIKAYYGLKDSALINWPYPNASAFPQPLTPTLIDTGHSNLLASMYSNSDKLCKVKGIGAEDIRKSPMVESVMNFKLSNQVDMYSVQDDNVFLSLLHGTNFIKVMQDFESNRVRPVSVRAENVFLPIDAKGCQVEDTDRIIQIIPWTYNDLCYRKGLRIGNKSVYDNLDAIPVGWRVSRDGSERLAQAGDLATGTSLHTRMMRDMYFVAEAYKSYCPKNGVGQYSAVRMGKPKEIIVWMSPNGGTVHRVIENKDIDQVRQKPLRPFSRYCPYPNPGRAYGMSLPEKIRNIQEKLDYADKQNTDALDRAINPAMFIDADTTFDPNQYQRVPMGIYPIPKGSKVSYEPQPPVERGFERQLEYLWELAQRVTGLSEVVQGRSLDKQRTLGEAKIITNRADIRFQTIFDRMDKGWKETMRLVYHYISKYTDPQEKVKVLGYSDYMTIEELFPKGIAGNYDFSFGGTPVSEIEKQKMDTIEWCANTLQDPATIQNPANWWRVKKMQAEAYGIRNLEEILTKPKEANVLSAEESIQRIVSGQYDIVPRPEIDAENYILEIQLFMRSQMYQGLDPKGQFAMQRLLQRCLVIAQAKRQADLDVIAAQQEMAQQRMIESDVQNDLKRLPQPAFEIQ